MRLGEPGSLKINIAETFVDPDTDEVVITFSMNSIAKEIRTPLADYFRFDGDVTVTDELNLVLRGEKWEKIAPLPDNLRPPTENA